MSPAIIATGKRIPEIVAEHLTGSYHPFGEKTMRLDEVFAGKNIRSNRDGGRFPRPGYQDTGIDFSAFAPTAGRGGLTAEFPAKTWLAIDNGTNVKIAYTDLSMSSAFYQQVYDTGLTLTTGKYVEILEWEGDIYYANGADQVGRIIVSIIDTGGVSAGSGTLNLKPGTGIRFPATGTGLIGTDAFAWTGVTGDQLTGCSGLLAHNVDEVVICTTTLSATFQNKASFLVEYVSSLNLAGDPKYPRVWEFSHFANPGDLTLFYNLDNSEPAGTELLGAGDSMSGWYKTNNYLYTFKKRSMYSTARTSIDSASGARTPNFVAKFGIPNPRCVDEMNGKVVFLATDRRLMPVLITIQNNVGTTVAQSPSLDPTFDTRIRTSFNKIDLPGDAEWVKFNQENQLLKIAVFVNGVRYIQVYDADLDIYYPPDDNKNFDFVVNGIDGLTYGFDGSSGKLYMDEVGNYDDDVPVASEWETGRIGQEFKRSTLRYVYLHGKMTDGSQAWIDVYKEGVFKFTKLLTDAYKVAGSDTYQVGYGGVGSSGFAIGGSGPTATDFRFPIGAYIVGQDFKVKVRMTGENGDFIQFDGLKLGVQPMARYPFKHV